MASRRFLITAVGLGAVALAVPRILSRRAPLPETRPIPGLPGYVRMRTGALSATPALAGIERPDAPPAAVVSRLQARPEAALFRDPPPNRVPLAVFTDVNCPNCRDISATLIDWITQDSQPIHVTWHELPRLGPSSDMGARASIAADLQGAYLRFHHHLMQNRFRPSAGYLRQLATEVGIDPDRLIGDMNTPQVTARLARSDALAYLFGIPGTPSMVVNRTLVIGALPKQQMARLIGREQ